MKIHMQETCVLHRKTKLLSLIHCERDEFMV